MALALRVLLGPVVMGIRAAHHVDEPDQDDQNQGHQRAYDGVCVVRVEGVVDAAYAKALEQLHLRKTARR